MHLTCRRAYLVRLFKTHKCPSKKDYMHYDIFEEKQHHYNPMLPLSLSLSLSLSLVIKAIY